VREPRFLPVLGFGLEMHVDLEQYHGYGKNNLKYQHVIVWFHAINILHGLNIPRRDIPHNLNEAA
jgi:hypothetical protein